MGKLSEIERSLGICFKNKRLLRLALTHKSYAYEHDFKEDNERLEFLGDSILNAVISDWLYHQYPNISEGKLSKLKSTLVNRQALAFYALHHKVGDNLFIGRHEGKKIRSIPKVLADTWEALLGAVYLDQGFEKSRQLILRKLEWFISSRGHEEIIYDYKSQLQELVQSQYSVLPQYTVISSTGPDHHKIFEVEVKVRGKPFGRGKEGSKKKAEQLAAREALLKIQGRSPLNTLKENKER